MKYWPISRTPCSTSVARLRAVDHVEHRLELVELGVVERLDDDVLLQLQPDDAPLGMVLQAHGVDQSTMLRYSMKAATE